MTCLRALVYLQSKAPKSKKPIDKQRLEAFFQLIDTIEFHLRQYCALKGPTEQNTRDLYTHLAKLVEEFPYKSGFFLKVLETLEIMIDTLRVLDYLNPQLKGFIPHTQAIEEYLPPIREYFTSILEIPLKAQLKCTIPANSARDIAKENLVLRSSLLLSQFKPKMQNHQPIIEDLMKIDEAFQKDDWVAANSILCKIMQSEFMKNITASIPQNFGDQQTFTPYKLAAGIISLVDFFNDVVTNSSTYRWINFGAVTDLTQYLALPQTSLEKGQLTPLQEWIKQLHDAGYSELPEACKGLFNSLKAFKDVKEKFEQENKEGLQLWLNKLQKNEIDADAYQVLCSNIDKSFQAINQAIGDISLHVNMTQAHIVLAITQKGIPTLDREVLIEQLTLLNKKIHDTCYPFIYFLHNFRIIMNKEKTAPNVYSLTLFEASKEKLFTQSVEAPVEVTIESDSEDDEIAVEEPIEKSEPATDTLKTELDEVFSNKKRRKIFEKLNAFFKDHNQKVRIETGKGSHLKIFLGGVPIIIPAPNEIKVGTAGSIRDDILKELRKLS